MKIINYQIGNTPKELIELIQKIYSSYPDVAEAKIQELKKINATHPFLKFGHIKHFLLTKDNKALAHASAIIDSRLDKNIALLGFFESLDKQEYADILFEEISKYLKSKNKSKLMGPVNLTTWNNWRIAYPENNKPFVTEPFSRAYYKNLFENFKFSVAQENISTISPINKSGFNNFESYLDKALEQGFIFETINTANKNIALRSIHKISQQTFVSSFNFVKIDLIEFLYYYKDARIELKLPFSCVVFNKAREAVAFCFAVQDNDNVVIKTFAIKDEYQGQSLSKALFAWLYKKAKQSKIKNFIFSTMRNDNKKILKLTHGQNIYRHYRTYYKKI